VSTKEDAHHKKERRKGRMMEKNNLTIEEAARLMGVSRQFVRVGLQRGLLPFGYAVQISTDRYTYFISKQKFAEYTGIG
jgi:hypothetical protein